MEYPYSKTFVFYKISYFDLNWTKYSMLHEFKIDIDLTEVFCLKKSSTCSSKLSPIEHIWEYKREDQTSLNPQIKEDLSNSRRP